MLDQTTIVIFSYNGHQNLLSHCLKSITVNLPRGYHEIIVVWDDNVDWQPVDFDVIRKSSGVNFRLINQSSIAQWTESISRWGWIKQQLAKLYCWKYVSTDYTWIVDGDVLLTGDPELFRDQRVILRFDSHNQVPDSYKFFAEKYLGFNKFQSNTFVGSTVLWKNSVCKDLEQRCIEHSGFDLVQAVDDMLAGDHPDLPFSEFEYYGHHICSSDSVVILPQNWNYVGTEQHWDRPIQIMWADNDCRNLDLRYKNLMQHRDPSSE